MSETNEITVQGHYSRIDINGYDDNPDYEGRITIFAEREIEVPLGMMDSVTPAGYYWNEDVVVRCQRMPDGHLALVAMDYDDDEEPEPDTGQSPQLPLPSLSDARSDNMAAQLLDAIANGGSDATSLPICYWKTVRDYTEQQGYRRWEIAMSDESVVEVNPIPSSSLGKPWLWTALHCPTTGRTLLTQGNATLALHEACRQMRQ